MDSDCQTKSGRQIQISRIAVRKPMQKTYVERDMSKNRRLEGRSEQEVMRGFDMVRERYNVNSNIDVAY